MEILDQSAELQLDFTTWRREIKADELERKKLNPMRSHVKVERVLGVNEETKGEDHGDILENYTFDLTLED